MAGGASLELIDEPYRLNVCLTRLVEFLLLRNNIANRLVWIM